MENTLVILVLAVVIFVLACGSREGFIDFGFSGYKKPITNFELKDGDAADLSNYKRDLTKVTPSEISSIISVIQKTAKEQTGQCLDPIQTVYINRYTNPQGGSLFDSRVVFFDKSHHFVTELTAQMLKNSNDTFSVLSLRTQDEIARSNGFAGDGTGANFLPETDLASAVAPSKGLLDKVVKDYEPPSDVPAAYGN